MAFHRVPERIIVDLDTLVDTRLMILQRLFSEREDLVFQHDKYLIRQSNFLEDFYENSTAEDQILFDDAYKNRNVDDLKSGFLFTTCFFGLQDLTERIATSNEIAPTAQDVSVTINFHPYEFTDEEKKAVIDSLSFHYFHAKEIKSVSISNDLSLIHI